MTELRIELPWPDSRLSPNQRSDRMAQTKPRQAARNVGYVLAFEAKAKAKWQPPASGFVRIVYTFHPPNRIPRDLDNLHLSLKYCADGVAKALQVDDAGWKDIRLIMGEPDKDKPRVVMEIGK